MKTEITRADIMPLAEYGNVRAERRRQMIELKKHRRLEVGPFATFYFESYETMWHQIHEMLWIEKGGEEQIADELTAYNSLTPNGSELIATLMFEIDDPVRRERVLMGLGGVEETVAIRVGNDTIMAEPELEDGVERTKTDGKTSSIHFLHFHFTPLQVTQFRDPTTDATVAITHENYGHMAVLPKAVRAALSADFVTEKEA